MLRSKTVKKELIQKSIKNFNALWGPFNERPLVDRVVSTPTWPVPYYQRLFKAYPIREKKDKASLLLSDFAIDETNWLQSKQFLAKTYRGREILSWAENHLDTKTHVITQTDCKNQARAYVNDLSYFLDIANKENKRILAKNDLI